MVALALGAFCVPGAPGQAQTQPAADGAIEGLNSDSFLGKEPTEGVYVRDSAGAVEKLALAQKMERLKEWAKSADLYQEVIIKYADRVVPSQLDADRKIYQYTSITNPVQERLAHWPPEGLEMYRARFEAPAQALLDRARPNDVATLNRVYKLYFVTEAGKQAGIRLIDVYLESGEFPAAAWLGDRLLSTHPSLLAERAAVLYRTALAYYYAGDPDKAKAHLDELKAQFPNDRGIVRGKDVILADSLARELSAPVSDSQFTSADSWPIAWGDPSRGRISSAEVRPGARLYGIPLSKPDWGSVNATQKDSIDKAMDEAFQEGGHLGIMPVADRGELYFQDGQRLYGVSIESGVPLTGWQQTYPKGVYVASNVLGSPRSHQLTLTLSEHHVLAVMGQVDPTLQQYTNQPPTGEPRLVCLNRENGREEWTVTLSQLPDDGKDLRALQFVGSPLVVGDSVIIAAIGAKTQFEDCYVIGFDLATGKRRWHTFLASASSGQFMWNAQQPMGDSTSHLAYANGRIYAQTNLGALAALDAYNGSVVWLDIYPTDRQNNDRQMNPFAAANQFQTPAHSPWTYNPVIVQGGYVFTLPTEGHNLLIYDAGTGTEIKRIDITSIQTKVDNLSRLDTLVGVVGDELLLAGEKGMICLNWKKYTRDGFNPEHDDITIWPDQFPEPIRGRPFLTRNLVFVPCQDRLYYVSLKTGKSVDEYPKHPTSGAGGEWEDPEEPGNVLLTNDYVVIAGDKMVNVYTDLGLAKTKLDREIAAAPENPQPRLRYAEVLFAAGEVDAAMARLDEAVGLLGGLQSLRNGANRDHLFVDALMYAEKLAKTHGNEDRERAGKLYDRAAAAASSPLQQVRYRLSRATFMADQKDFLAAVKLYEEILCDPQLRTTAMPDEPSPTPLQAGAVAEREIGAIIADHADAYESFQQGASAAVDAAQQSPDDPAGKLLEIARCYPNSAVAGKAMIAAAEKYEAASDPRHAIRVLRDMWFKYPQSPDRPRILESLARNYLILADGARPARTASGLTDYMEAAAASLARAAALPGDLKLEKPIRLPDGAVVDAGAGLPQALETVRKFRVAEVSRTLPDFHLPMGLPPYIPGQPRLPHPKPFLKEDPQRDVVANVKLLVPAAQDFSRADRAVVFTADNRIDIYPAGATRALASGQALGEEPKGCAWVGDDVLVWGGSQLAYIRAGSGDAAWKIDLRQLQAVDVVRVGDTAQTIAIPGADPNVVIVNGGRRVFIRNGQRVIFPGGGFRQPMVAPPPPAVRIASGAEEIVEVRPVGDHVLLTTTAGRILSAELGNGHIAWQTRLSDRPVDRLVANEDFAVVKVSDDATLRIAAFDTATGQLRCTHNWLVQNGMFPLNLALAPDGTLVYTLPDRLCIKDLYKPWGDATDKEVQANPALPAFQKATQPDQLLIAEGRILALATDGTIKYVRVHSLETGQPVPLRYRAPDGDKEVDRVLTAGKSDRISLRVVGSHLYVINPQGVISYNLDRPVESWSSPEDEPDQRQLARNCYIGRKFLALLDETAAEEAPGPPIPVNAPAPGAAAPAAPANSAAPVEFDFQIYARYPVSDKNPAETGREEYVYRVTDPAGILPAWQAADGGFYYVTGDKKLHFLRGSETEK